MTWNTHQPPRIGAYLAVDGYGSPVVAQWRPELGWCVRGRWEGHKGVLCWMELPSLPDNIRELGK